MYKTQKDKWSKGTVSLTLLLWSLIWKGCCCWIAYDCQTPSLNITTISLLDIGKCKPPTDKLLVYNETIQLLQVRDYELLPVYQCKIHVTRFISHCGIHSHMSAVRDGFATYLYPINRQMCNEMHNRRELSHFFGKHISELKINGTIYATVLMAGQMTGENSCKGSSFEDPRGSWSDVIVQAILQILLYAQYAPANTQENNIQLPGGTTCTYKDKFCIDSEFGYSYWEHVDNFQCSKTKYTVLYEGIAQKLVPQNTTLEDPIIYSVEQGETIFAMPISRPTTICGQSAYETDHPKFFILKPAENGMFYFKKRSTNHLNLDPNAYTNSKFVFLEKHLRGQISSLYAEVTSQRCELEQQVLRNLQVLAVIAPTEFAYVKMKAPGYTAVNYGEVVHIIQCHPVEVRFRTSNTCYHETPIVYDNKSLFMSPRTHIIQRYALEIDCNLNLYPLYKLDNRWYKIHENIHEAVSPQLLEPYIDQKWEYKSPRNLFMGGIYSAEDLEKWQNYILLPAERQAVAGIMSRGMIYNDADLQGTNINHLIDEVSLKEWIKNSWTLIWNWFLTFGTVTSGCLGVFIVLKGIKLIIIDTIIHGMLLYEIFGWSLNLLAAAFNSITMYFMHRHHRQNNQNDVETNKEQEKKTKQEANKTHKSMKLKKKRNPGKNQLYPNIDENETEEVHSPEWLDAN